MSNISLDITTQELTLNVESQGIKSIEDLANEFIFSFNTVAELQAYTLLNDGQIAFVIDKQRGGLFAYEAGANQADDDDGTIFAMDTIAGCVNRDWTGVVAHTGWWGVKADSTGIGIGTDDTLAIQTAINAVSNMDTVLELWFEAKGHRTTSTIYGSYHSDNNAGFNSEALEHGWLQLRSPVETGSSTVQFDVTPSGCIFYCAATSSPAFYVDRPTEIVGGSLDIATSGNPYFSRNMRIEGLSFIQHTTTEVVKLNWFNAHSNLRHCFIRQLDENGDGLLLGQS